MDKAKWLIAAGVLVLTLGAQGCARSAPQQAGSTTEAATPTHLELQTATANQPTTAPADFSGEWSVKWCNDKKPNLDCGGFWVTLVQEGDRICGSFDGARVNLSQVDEGGRVVGSAVGNTAVLAAESGRNGMIALVRAELDGEKLHWKEVGNIKRGGTDIAIMATDDVLAKSSESPKGNQTCDSILAGTGG